MADTVSIVPVEASDLPTLGADLLYPQKLALTINRLLFNEWPNEPTQKSIYTGTVESAFNDHSVECLKAVDSNGNIIGYLALTRKRRAEKAKEPATNAGDGGEGGMQDVPPFFNPSVLSAVQAAVTSINLETQSTEHYELTYIVVTSTHRRRGIGSQLAQVCFDRAKAGGLPLAVTSEPAAYDFFSKLGFRDTRQVDMDLSKWAPRYSGFGVFRLSGMIWEP